MKAEFIAKENDYLDFQIKASVQAESANNYIKQFGWYLTPFIYGDQIQFIEEFASSNTGTKDTISEVFKRTLFDTRMLAIHMEAFYKKLPFLSDFSFIIDQGIILYLQHDFAGAISTLVPVIEGVIRNYLKTKGNTGPTFRDLKNSFGLMQQDIIDVETLRYTGKGLSLSEYSPLLQKQTNYLSKWIFIIEDFIQNTMYLDTRSGTATDYLNRHLILHGLSNDIYYNFSNAAKSYVVIQYLAWIFIQMNPSFSTIPDIKEEEFSSRHAAYNQIKLITIQQLDGLKDELYKGHTQYNKDYLK